MKLAILGLMLSFSALAKTNTSVFPQVSNYGSSVEVRIYNYTDRPVSCSGSIYMTTQLSGNRTEYYFNMISAGFNDWRTYRLPNLSDRVISVYHSITCF